MNDKEKEKNDMEIAKENQDYQNIPESSSHKSPPKVDKEDIKKASELNKEGKTDNTEKP